MPTASEVFQTFLNAELDLLPKVIASLAVVLLLGGLRFLTVYFVNRRTEDANVRYHWRKISIYVATGLGVVLITPVWLNDARSLATFLGLTAAGLVIVLKDPISNVAGWVFILLRQPLKVGDRIQIGQHAGDVVDLRLFEFSLLEIGNWVAADQSTGRIIHIPNMLVFSEPLANYTQSFEYIWHEIPVLITFESNWEKAKTILQEIANRHGTFVSQEAAERVRRAANRYLIRYSKLTPIVYTSVQSSGVSLTIRYMCEARRRRSSQQDIWEDVLRTFAVHPDIRLAYPTQRFYQRGEEQLSGTDQRPNLATILEDNTQS